MYPQRHCLNLYSTKKQQQALNFLEIKIYFFPLLDFLL